MKLRLENVHIKLSNKKILNDINFSAEKGAFLSVLGPSGCGKSTLLKTIAGIIPCNSGYVFINERDTSNIPTHKRGAVIVFQDIRLFPHMSVDENIAFSLKMKGIPRKERSIRVSRLIDRVQLTGFEDRKPGTLSGGQQQRVALARALAVEPEVLLLDEPFSGLDENLRFDMRILVTELHREHNMTTIMVTHDKEEALSMSDFILVMDEGCIIQSGQPKEVYERPGSLIMAKYFGNGAFVKGRVSGNQFVSSEFVIDHPVKDGSYVLMVRWNAVQIVKGTGFRIIQTIYTGRQQELLLEHVVTGLKIRCCDEHGIGLYDSEVSLRLVEDKLIFFRDD